MQVLAQKHNRSLEDEIKAIIAQVAEAEQIEDISVRAAFREKLNQVRKQQGNHLFTDSVEMLREDRNR